MQASRPTAYGLVAVASVIGLALPALVVARPGQLTSASNVDFGSQRGVLNFCGEENTIITESADLSTLDGESLVCSGSAGTASHAYGRSHDLSGIDAGGNDIALQCATWGIKQSAEDLDATVNVYADDDGDPSNGLSFIGSASATIPASSVPLYQTFDFNGLVVPAQMIFIELVVEESTATDSHNIGANDAGETSPSWIRTLDGSCGVGNWSAMANIGYPQVQWVEQIEVAIATPADPCNDPLPECSGDISGGDGTPDGVV